VGPALLLAGALLTRDEGAVLGALVVVTALAVVPRGAARPAWRRVAVACLVLALGSAAAFQQWSGLVRNQGLFDLRSTWSEPETPRRIWEHRGDVPAILEAVALELAQPSAQSRSSPLEDWLGVSLLWPLFLAACVILCRRGATDAMGLRSAIVVIGGLLVYTLGFIAFPYQNLDDLRDNWLRVLDRHALAVGPLAVRTMASAFSAAGPRPDPLADDGGTS